MMDNQPWSKINQLIFDENIQYFAGKKFTRLILQTTSYQEGAEINIKEIYFLISD